MAYSIFAAIDIGSSCLEMAIYEISKENGIKKLDHIRHMSELGKSTYASNEINLAEVDELCDVLYEFSRVMKSYAVTDYKAFATSALREAKNAISVLDRIKVRTGLDVKILSNSEQRFVNYKAVAAKDEKFNKIIEKSTALVDVSAGSTQVSIFDNGTLVTTQKVMLGALRINEMLSNLSKNVTNYLEIMKEYIDNDMTTLNDFFIKGKKINNVIFIGDFIPYYTKQREYFKDGEYASRVQFNEFYEHVYREKAEHINEIMDIPYEHAKLILPSAMVYKRLLDITQAETIWMPGTTICDGIAVEFAEKNKKLKLKHDFEADILAAAKNISKRYSINKNHTNMVGDIALQMFDTIKKYHGLGERERFLLQIACILHDVGQYINMLNPAQSSYSIIMSTEIIGLSHLERKIIASVVKYTTIDFDSDDTMWAFDKKSYLIIAKLSAILRLGNSMDKGHRQKYKNIKMQVDEGELIVTVETFEDITVEKAYFSQQCSFFEEMYGLKPVMKQKR